MASEVCTVRRTPAKFCAPYCCATTTVVPEATPTNRLTMTLISVPVTPPTAASACLPTNWPTITASAVLYSCWKNVPSRMGKKNTSSCFQMTPSVMGLYARSLCACAAESIAKCLPAKR